MNNSNGSHSSPTTATAANLEAEEGSNNNNNNNNSSNTNNSNSNSNSSADAAAAAVVVAVPTPPHEKSGGAMVETLDSGEEFDEAEVDYTIVELLSFRGSEHLLRAAPLDVLLRGGGRIFSSSAGTEATYSLSSAAHTIGYFISHNWTVCRAAKFLALAFKFNMKACVALTMFFAAVCFITGILGAQPMFNTLSGERTAIGCRLLMVPACVAALVFGRLCNFRRSGPSVFLDKVCIHQVDTSLQKAGIRKLGAFLRVSDRMLILYSSVYLRRLWTIYEVASFLCMHAVEKLELVPIMLPAAFLMILGVHFGVQLTFLSIQLLGLPVAWFYILNYLGSSAYFMSTRIWAKSKAEMQQTLENFSVHNAFCTVESDRPAIYANIVALMRASKKVKRKSSSREALEAFDQEVRMNLMSQFNRLFGRFAFSHVEYIILSATVWFPGYVDSWSRISVGDTTWREIAGDRVLDMFWLFSGTTLWHFAMEYIGSFNVELSGWRNIAYVFGTNFFITLVGNTAYISSQVLAERARTDDVLLVMLLLAQVVTTGLSFLIFPKLCSQHRSFSSKAVDQSSGGRMTLSSSLSSESSITSSQSLEEGLSPRNNNNNSHVISISNNIISINSDNAAPVGTDAANACGRQHLSGILQTAHSKRSSNNSKKSNSNSNIDNIIRGYGHRLNMASPISHAEAPESNLQIDNKSISISISDNNNSNSNSNNNKLWSKLDAKKAQQDDDEEEERMMQAQSTTVPEDLYHEWQLRSDMDEQAIMYRSRSDSLSLVDEMVDKTSVREQFC